MAIPLDRKADVPPTPDAPRPPTPWELRVMDLCEHRIPAGYGWGVAQIAEALGLTDLSSLRERLRMSPNLEPHRHWDGKNWVFASKATIAAEKSGGAS